MSIQFWFMILWTTVYLTTTLLHLITQSLHNFSCACSNYTQRAINDPSFSCSDFYLVLHLASKCINLNTSSRPKSAISQCKLINCSSGVYLNIIHLFIFCESVSKGLNYFGCWQEWVFCLLSLWTCKADDKRHKAVFKLAVFKHFWPMHSHNRILNHCIHLTHI